jgi:hypothetical protein
MVQQNETDREISTFDTALLAVTDSRWMADVTFLAGGDYFFTSTPMPNLWPLAFLVVGICIGG